MPAAKAIPGPGRFETLRALTPLPFRKMPAFLDSLARRYGSISSFSLPWRTFVFINDAALVKEVLVTQQHAFVKSFGVRAMRLVLGEGLLTSEDPLHRQMRRVVQPAFHRERIAAYGETMLGYAREWAARCNDDRSFDMHAAMSELTLRIAGTTLFGADAGEQARTVREALRVTLEAYPHAVGPLGPLMRLPLAQRLPFGAPGRLERARAALDAVVFDLIAKRRQRPEEGTDALSLLLAATASLSEGASSDEQIRDEVMTLFLAGHETTANALVWTWYLLSQSPDVERRLHEEVDGLAEHDDPLALYSNLEYTRRVVREAMRLYPPAWVIGRETRHDVRLGDCTIAAGTTVFISPLVLHRSPNLYGDPLRFDPDRWLHNDDLHPFAYIPFGGGARRCIGEEFAWMEIALLVATIARHFRFRGESARAPDLDPMVTLRPKGAVLMRAHARPSRRALIA